MKTLNEIYSNCSQIDYDKRTDAEKAVVWQHNQIINLQEQIEELQKTNLINVDPGIHLRKFGGDGADLAFESEINLHPNYDVDLESIEKSFEIVKAVVTLACDGDIYEYSHYQLVINFPYVNI